MPPRLPRHKGHADSLVREAIDGLAGLRDGHARVELGEVELAGASRPTHHVEAKADGHLGAVPHGEVLHRRAADEAVVEDQLLNSEERVGG
eukprot:3723059-Pleurochrysis_carterae.AAC.1